MSEKRNEYFDIVLDNEDVMETRTSTKEGLKERILRIAKTMQPDNPKMGKYLKEINEKDINHMIRFVNIVKPSEEHLDEYIEMLIKQCVTQKMMFEKPIVLEYKDGTKETL